MVNEQLYRERDEQEPDEVFIEPPVNKTLFIIQLTDDMPIKPEETENLTSLAEVFDYYKPSFDFDCMNADESIVKETFLFNRMEDFHPENIIQRSPCLNELHLIKEQLAEMNKRLPSNSQLANILLSPARRKDFTGMIKSLINDLEKEV